MDSSWQVKCGSAFPSSMPAMASSSLKETRDQMEMNSGNCFYAGQDLRFQIHKRKLDTTFPSINSSCSSTFTDLSSSFLSLLSEPAALLQFDIQELSIPKLFNTSTGMACQIGRIAGTPFGHQVPETSVRPSKIVGVQNLRSGNDLYPTILSSSRACSNSGRSSIFQSSHPAVNISVQGPDLATTTIYQTVFGNEKEKEFYSLEEGANGMPLINDFKIQNANRQMLQKLPVEVKRFASNNSSISNSGCPRVFCLDKSGDLLLSNTGLLGILCSCHCFHMSVSRFCEHSGLRDVNPGDCIRVDSGETISQWRRTYFQKCGIRIPEDLSGWDWPEGLSFTANAVKSGVSMSNILKYSESSNLVDPSGDILRSGWPLGEVSEKNFLVNKNSVFDDLHDKHQRSGQDCNKTYLDGLVGSSRNNSCDMGDDRVSDYSTFRRSTMPNFAGRGPENICQSIYGNAVTTHPAQQHQKILVKNFALSRGDDVHDFSVTDKVASSSRMELKLGQPCHQSHRPGSLVIGPVFHNTTVNPLKSFSPEQDIHNVGCMFEERSKAHVPHAVGLSNSTRREENHLIDTNCALKLDKLNGNMAKSSMVPLSAHSTSVGRSSHSASTDLLHVYKHVIPETQHYHSINYNPSRAPMNDDNCRKPGSRNLGLAEDGKGMEYLTGNSCVQAISGSQLQKWMKNTSSSTEVVNGFNFYVSSPMQDERHYSRCSPNMPLDASNAGRFLKSPEKVHYCGSSGHTDHVFFQSKCSPSDYIHNLLSQGDPICSASSTQSPTPGFVAAISRQDSSGISSYSLDDSQKMLVLGQMTELCEKQRITSSLRKNLEQGKHSESYNVKIKHSFVEPSIYKEQTRAPNPVKKPGISEMAIAMKSDHSDPPSTKGNSIEKCTLMSGFSRWCNNSSPKLGKPLKDDEVGKHCQLSHNPRYNDQSLFRLGGSQSTIYSDGLESCYQKTFCCRCNCGCVSHTNCNARSHTTRGGNLPNSLREQTGHLISKTPILIASPFVNDHTVPKGSAISFNQCGRMSEQLPKNVNCCASQQNDMPSQVKQFCESACMKHSDNAFERRRHELFQVKYNAAKHSNRAVHVDDSFEELDVSNTSYGCSTPTFTPASTEVANVDFSTITKNTGYSDNQIVDEGSNIDNGWSSDDAIESGRSADFYGCKSKLRMHKSCNVTSRDTNRSLLEEVKLMDFLTWKKGQNLKHSGNVVHWKRSQSHETEKPFKSVKRIRETQLKMLDSISGTEVPLLRGKSSECGRTTDWHFLSQNIQMDSCGPESSGASVAHSTKIKSKSGNSRIIVTKTQASERDFYTSHDSGGCSEDYETEINHDNFCENLGISGRKKFRCYHSTGFCMQSRSHESTEAGGQQNVMYDSGNYSKTPSSQRASYCDNTAKPVVCGKYGEITNGNMSEDLLERVKIVSLNRVLKSAKRCSLPKKYESGLTSSKELNKRTFAQCSAYQDKSSNLTKRKQIRSNSTFTCEEANNHISIDERDNASTDDDERCGDDFSMMGKKYHGNSKVHIVQDTGTNAHLRPKHKETRKRSLYELMLRGNNPCKVVSQKKFKCTPKMKLNDILKDSDESPNQARQQRHLSLTHSNLCCCVCGSSNEDEVNCLLDCSQCSIRVHQACYGVSKAPKGHWYCRPCRANSENNFCVLCGYGGGAMTRASQCHTFMSSILKAWNLETQNRPKNAISSGETLPDEQSTSCASPSVPGKKLYPTRRPINSKLSTSSNQFNNSDNSVSHVSHQKLHNSITAGACDSTVTQWVHMVCGLWTPGTRCPNVDTMSSFDISDVLHPRENVVCSMCKRRGGSLIQCRVANCSIQFHPWCAHQKGLLQNETEGVDNENVGFYGRCVVHATFATNEFSCDGTTIEENPSEENKPSCARTEGYKGRKKDGFWHNFNTQPKGKGGYFVHQEQLNAWIHINGQKSCANGLFKQQMSEQEYDYRKDYACHGQEMGREHLVVYKSAIHALGLYTSRFISRGEMVVEYIGEIVGQRVADKRENEYQSGRRLQYKSACYFFRIDKGHIIDATFKGGIARFVNHSCSPNCMARVISARNEKKVIFFAERDIYPGEEITYDYHFNHEDEGKKIPCFCNSKNCRQYLN